MSMCESEKKAEQERVRNHDQQWSSLPAWKAGPDVLSATLRPWTVASNSLSADDAVCFDFQLTEQPELEGVSSFTCMDRDCTRLAGNLLHRIDPQHL
jgi:hypothetical protein